MNFPSKTITIASIEVIDNAQIAILDQDGDRYTFYKTKKSDGLETVAYKGFKDFQLAENSIIEASFKINGQWKNIMSFKRASSQAMASALPFVSQKEVQIKQDDKWDQIAQGKVRHAFALEAYKAGKTLDVSTATTIAAWTNYVMTGKLKGPVEDTGGIPDDVIDSIDF